MQGEEISKRMKSLGLIVTLAFLVASCFPQDATKNIMVTNSISSDHERPIYMNTPKLTFPQDYCFHTNANEWFYFSGVIETSEGKEFGLMFTIFQFPVIGVTSQLTGQAFVELSGY